MTKDEALIKARDLLSKRLDLPHNDEAAELVAEALLRAFDQGSEVGWARGRAYDGFDSEDNPHHG